MIYSTVSNNKYQISNCKYQISNIKYRCQMSNLLDILFSVSWDKMPPRTALVNLSPGRKNQNHKLVPSCTPFCHSTVNICYWKVRQQKIEEFLWSVCPSKRKNLIWLVREILPELLIQCVHILCTQFTWIVGRVCTYLSMYILCLQTIYLNCW